MPPLLFGTLEEFLLVGLLQTVEQRGSLAADRLAVHLADRDAVRAGGQDHDLVCGQQLVDRERRDAGRDAQPAAQLEEMLARDAREDELVRRGRTEHAVADDGEAGMRALGDAVAAMEYDLVAAGLDRALHCHAVRNEVERLDVAVQETGVLDRDEFVGMVVAVERAGLRERHQRRLCAGREGVLAVRCGARGLPVQHVRRVAVQTADQIVQRCGELAALHRRLDAQQPEAVVEAVEMIVERKDLLVADHGGVVNAVAEIQTAVGDRRLNLVDAADFSVIVCNILHWNMPPLIKIPIFIQFQYSVFRRDLQVRRE